MMVICTSMLLETMGYYNKNGTYCYLLLLDLSKAFDCVEYVKLFTILRDRRRCPIVLRLLNENMQRTYVKLIYSANSSEMEQFNFNVEWYSNSCKQGGCLSPTRFSVHMYLNKLIEILKKLNIRCNFNNH